MSVNGQQQARTGMFLGLVVLLSRIPEIDQQAILVSKVIDPIAEGRVIQVAEEVRAHLQGFVIALVCAELKHIVLALERDLVTIGYMEAGYRLIGPAGIR